MIQVFDSGILSSNMFIIEENGHAIVVDPALDTSRGEKLIIDFLLITHEHYDHISGVNAWKKEYHVPLLCSEACAARITDPKKNQARHFDAFCEIQSWMQINTLPQIDATYTCEADKTFQDNAVFEWQGHILRMTEIPGHSPGSIGIYIDNDDFFSGDSLLKDTEIELRFPGGSRKQWLQMGEQKIKSVPKGTRIWPGHGKPFILE